MAHIAVVDDAQVQRRILAALLEKQHAVNAYASGEAFLAAIDGGECFDLVLLDIEMNGIDGYETCRRLRAAGHVEPVMFVSAHDTAPERVAAYEAGGDDFVIKPVTARELQLKVTHALEQRAVLQSLDDQSRMAQQAAFAAMTSMGELGVPMEFMRNAAACSDAAAIADALLAAIAAYGLQGLVQVRDGHAVLDKSTPGGTTPLQNAVLASLCDMGRIFIFGSRGIVNHTHISLLVHNLPTDDDDRLGRLRDNLALLVEAAETRLVGLIQQRTLGALQSDARHTLARLQHLLADAAQRVHVSRQHNQRHMGELFDTLIGLIESYQVTDIQRETLRDVIAEGLDRSMQLQDEAALAEGDFIHIIDLLENLANGKT